MKCPKSLFTNYYWVYYKSKYGGGAENAGRENDGREIDGPICRA